MEFVDRAGLLTAVRRAEPVVEEVETAWDLVVELEEEEVEEFRERLIREVLLRVWEEPKVEVVRLDKLRAELLRELREELTDFVDELVDFREELVDLLDELTDRLREAADFREELVDFWAEEDVFLDELEDCLEEEAFTEDLLDLPAELFDWAERDDFWVEDDLLCLDELLETALLFWDPLLLRSDGAAAVARTNRDPIISAITIRPSDSRLIICF